MNTYIITPKNEQEERFLDELLQKLDIEVQKIVDNEELENKALYALMQEADRSKKASKEKIIQKLRQK